MKNVKWSNYPSKDSNHPRKCQSLGVFKIITIIYVVCDDAESVVFAVLLTFHEQIVFWIFNEELWNKQQSFFHFVLPFFVFPPACNLMKGIAINWFLLINIELHFWITNKWMIFSGIILSHGMVTCYYL